MRYEFKVSKWSEIDIQRVISENSDSSIITVTHNDNEFLCLVYIDDMLMGNDKELGRFGTIMKRVNGWQVIEVEKVLITPLIKYVLSCKRIPDTGVTVKIRAMGIREK